MTPCAVCGEPSELLVCGRCGPRIRPLPRKAGSMPNWFYWPGNWPELMLAAIDHEADRVADLAAASAIEAGLDTEAGAEYVAEARRRVAELWNPVNVVYPDRPTRVDDRRRRDSERRHLVATRSPTGLTYTGLL